MTRYLISFPSGAMNHIPAEEFPAVGEAAHAVVQEAMDAGVWVFGGGLAENVDPVMVAGDRTITAGTYPQTEEFNGGFTVLDLPSREAAFDRTDPLDLSPHRPEPGSSFEPGSRVSIGRDDGRNSGTWFTNRTRFREGGVREGSGMFPEPLSGSRYPHRRVPPRR